MDKESINWFRFSKLIIDVGTDVLRTRVLDHAQTPFVYKLEQLWMEEVQKIKAGKFATKLISSFYGTLIVHKQNNSTRIKLPTYALSQKNIPLSEQVSMLERWKDDLEKQLSYNASNDNDLLSSWLEKIHTGIEDLNIMRAIIQKWTDCFLKLCKELRQDLLSKIEHHYDQFLFSCRKEIAEWTSLSTEELKREIINLESERKNKLESWTEVSERWLTSLVRNIEKHLTTWENDLTDLRDHKCKKLLATPLERLKDETSQLNKKKLQSSFYKWHEELRHRLKVWLDQVDSRGDMSSLDISFEDDLRKFPSVSSHQSKDFFVSKKIQKRLIECKLSVQILSKLSPSSGFPEIKTFDTSFLYAVLRCLVDPPMTDRNIAMLTKSEQSLSAHMFRLKSFRNEIVAHIHQARIDNCRFDSLWSDVTNVVCQLALESGHKYETQVRMEIWRMKICEINSEIEHEFSNILNWCKNDILAEFKEIGTCDANLHMLEKLERVEHRRLRRREGSCQTDEDTSKSQSMYTQTENVESQCVYTQTENIERHCVDTQTVNTASHRQTRNSENQTIISFPGHYWDNYWTNWHPWHWRYYHQE